MEFGQTGLTPGKGRGFPLPPPTPPTPTPPYLPVSGTAGLCWLGSVRRSDFLNPLISYKLHTRTGPSPLPSGSWVWGKGQGLGWLPNHGPGFPFG